MTVDDWPEWLPADWMIQIRKIDERKVKCFIDPEGHKFYSKPQVDRHLKTVKNSTAIEKTHNSDGPTLDLTLEPDVPHTDEDPESTPRGQSIRPKRTGSSIKTYKEPEVLETGDGTSSEPKSRGRKTTDSSWLPDGWTVEVKTKRTGQKYKIFVDPNGKKLFSKPQVLSYLANTTSSPAGQKEGEKTPTRPEKSQISEPTEANKDESARMPPDYEVISSTPADGLPPGWIKEIRMRTHGSGKKKDPYYLDPLSGYVFFSKLDALRYLDSGDIKKCAMRPLRRDTSQENNQIGNLNEEELASPPEPSKEPETPKAIQNGGVTESITEGTGTEKKKARSITGDGLLPMPKSSQKDASWLPDGWVVEMKYRDNGMKIKCYKETATGKNFYSKPQVLSYLGTESSTPNTNSRKRKIKMMARKSYTEQDSSPDSGSEDGSPRKRSRKTRKPVDLSDYKETILKSPAEGLPPGWIKEVKSRLCAGRERKDPFYIDPVSGYVFRSKLDAIRYLETGDINLCAIRPRKRDENGNEVAIPDETPKPKPTKQVLEGGSDMEAIDIDKEVETSDIDPKNNTENTPDSTPTPGSGRARRATRERAAKHTPAPVPARSSTRLKGIKPHTKTDENAPQPDNGAIPEKVVAGVNLEKQGSDDEQLDYQLEDDSSWTDQFDFAVKTLVGEFPPNESGGVGNGSPAKAN
ncbi:hypothetical protein L2E82_47524 [Cichorium intybus]|uniref:Uncharacterized protein n=1 Tax=Cichorium intybus TaxID=13427 RepID=A0ACB8YVZ7_CICIN|nr:hypothetical protein L2E82_47524 [Cichorium intybus]